MWISHEAAGLGYTLLSPRWELKVGGRPEKKVNKQNKSAFRIAELKRVEKMQNVVWV